MSSRIVAQHLVDGMVVERQHLLHGPRRRGRQRSSVRPSPQPLVTRPSSATSRVADSGTSCSRRWTTFSTVTSRPWRGHHDDQADSARAATGSGGRDRRAADCRHRHRVNHGSLVTDGSFLYWQSDTAMSKMPVGGGAVTVLDTIPLTRPATGVYLVGPNLIYAVDRVVHYVAVDGSAIPSALPAGPGHDRHRRRRLSSRWRDPFYVADRNGAVGWAFQQRKQPDQAEPGRRVHHLDGLRRADAACHGADGRDVASAPQVRRSTPSPPPPAANPGLAMFNPEAICSGLTTTGSSPSR